MSRNGEFLVRLGDWGSGDFDGGVGGDGLAIAFYKRGEELKRYTVSDLVEYKPRIRWGSDWLLYYTSPTLLGGDELQLDTVDELRYRFDLHTGEIVSKVRLEPEKLPPDLTPEERVAIIWGKAAMDTREMSFFDANLRILPSRLAAIETRISTYVERIRELGDQDTDEVEKELRRAHHLLQRDQQLKEAHILQIEQLIEEAIEELRKYPLIKSRRLEVEAALRSGWMPTENPGTASRHRTR